ncbi:MAG: cupin domain-containing protein [Flavobacteriales bacterium]
MIKAYRLFTGADGDSHFEEGTLREHDRNEVSAIHFAETTAHGNYDWHTAPEEQYVITLSGTLEFTVRDGHTFILRPGEVLLAQDTTGTAHKWRMLGDDPWRRAYVVLRSGAGHLFVPDVGTEA